MMINRQNNTPVLKDVFFKVFTNNDPFDKMFTKSISHKILLYPTNGYYLSKKQFSALIRTVKILGETSYYLSEIEGQAFIKNDNYVTHQPEHWELSISTSYEKYKKILIIFENALYSPRVRWGGIISHEDHAVFGGSKEFITTFKNLYPDWVKDQEKFVKAVKYWGKLSQTNQSWVTNFLKYINK